MKQSIFYFMLTCMIVGLFSSCTKDDSSFDDFSEKYTQKMKWYGVRTLDDIRTRGVADQGKLWNSKAGITIKFINNPAEATLIDRVKLIAQEWEEYAGIKFNFVENDKNANVRIAFNWNGNDWLTWSYTGTDARFIRSQTQPTAVFGGLDDQDEDQLKGDILRVFGQILGLEYEQRHQNWNFWKNESKLESYWVDMFEGMNMDWNEIKDYVFTPLTGENAIYPTQTSVIDELSVMAWPYYTRIQTTKLIVNNKLSEEDKKFIGKLYPKEKVVLPTIQEAWVNKGYFVWRTKENTSWFEDGMVALKLTDLGAQQESFPEVSDGEQLTSVRNMFSGDKRDGYYGTWYELDTYGKNNLKKAPAFNTSNVTDFSSMFYGCHFLESLPDYDTLKGVNFNRMLFGCSSLKAMPSFNTTNGKNFAYMLANCSSLNDIPVFDTSQCQDFTLIFYGCHSLVELPQINTSQGVRFIHSFRNCTSLKSIPLLDTSKATEMSSIFRGCVSLEEIPLLNTSNVTRFGGMFDGCTSLKRVPLLDTSKGESFESTFEGCSSLASIPLLNTSSASRINGMFKNCTSLETIPLLDTSNARDFLWMFEGCTSLKRIPLLNTSKGTAFARMFYDCNSLVEKPILDLSNVPQSAYEGGYMSNIFKGTPFDDGL